MLGSTNTPGSLRCRAPNSGRYFKLALRRGWGVTAETPLEVTTCPSALPYRTRRKVLIGVRFHGSEEGLVAFTVARAPRILEGSTSGTVSVRQANALCRRSRHCSD